MSSAADAERPARSARGGSLARLLPRNAPPGARRYLAAFLYVVGATVIAEILFRTFDTNRLSMIFLAAVLLSGIRLGSAPAFFAAVLAFLVYNFYLVEPRFTISLGSAEDYFVLIAFLAVALLTGGLAGRLRDENETSTARARSLAALFEATREMSATEAEGVLGERLAGKLAQAVGGPAWVIGPDEAPPAAWGLMLPEERDRLMRMFASGREGWPGQETLADGVWRMRPLNADGRSLGMAVWRAPQDRDGSAPEAEHLARVLAEVGAGALARARLGAEKAEIESVARTERLRTALLSSISHDFRTPLAAILASATSLIDFDQSFDAATRKDLLSNIQEEVERLNRFVANLLNMTRLESGALELKIVPVQAAEAAGRAVEHLRRRLGARRVSFAADGGAVLLADPVLLEQVLTNLVENATSFSADGSEISIAMRDRGERVEIEVADQGVGVPAADLPRLFDKFYRASNARQSAAGSGLGLSICKGLVEAMGGAIEARPRPDGAPGLSIVITLPGAA